MWFSKVSEFPRFFSSRMEIGVCISFCILGISLVKQFCTKSFILCGFHIKISDAVNVINTIFPVCVQSLWFYSQLKGGEYNHPGGSHLLSPLHPSHQEKPIHPPWLPPLCYDCPFRVFRGDKNLTMIRLTMTAINVTRQILTAQKYNCC